MGTVVLRNTKGTELEWTEIDANFTNVSTLPQTKQSADYTLVSADNGNHVYHPSADTNARTWTIPAGLSVGTTIVFVNDIGAGVITILSTETLALMGSTTATTTRTLAASGMATAVKVDSSRWVVSGVGLT